MASTDPLTPEAPAAPAAPAAPGGRVTAAIARWTLIVHVGLLAAQPFLAGAMLDAMSATAQTLHRDVAMALVSVGLVQVIITLIAWRGAAGWPRDAFWASLAMWIIELVQFALGHLSLSMAVHIPLGIALLGLGLYLVYTYARRR